MRKTFLALAVCSTVVVWAQSAGAQARRDPFAPLVSEAAVGGEAGAATTTEPAPIVEPEPIPGVTDGVPNTGTDIGQVAILALSFIALGIGALAAARMYRPVAPRVRRGLG